MKRNFILILALAILCVLSSCENPQREKALAAVDALENAATRGYTMLDSKGFQSPFPYYKDHFSFFRNYCTVTTHDVFFKVREAQTGDIYFTKCPDIMLYKNRLCLENDFIISEVSENTNGFDFYVDENADSVKIYIDAIEYEKSENFEETNVPPKIEDMLNRKEILTGRYELEFYKCGGKATKNIDNMFFQFETAQKISLSSADIDRKWQNMSNVDILFECRIISNYCATKKDSHKKRYTLELLDLIKDKKRRAAFCSSPRAPD